MKLILVFAVICGAASPQQYTIDTFVGGGPPLPAASTVATSTSIGVPAAVTADSKGNIYFTAGDPYTVNRIYKLDRNGMLSRVAGSSAIGFSGDGGPAANARLYLRVLSPNGGALATDDSGSLFVADTGNNRVRKISPDGIIVTVAGNGNQGYSGDGGLAVEASLNSPAAVGVDPDGNLLIADTGNGVIRKVSPAGAITSLPGSLYQPGAVAADRAGNVFIRDWGNVLKLSPAGVLTTIAPSFNNNAGLTVDRAGNLLYADLSCSCVRRVSSSGSVGTVVGGPPGMMRAIAPYSVAVDLAGEVIVADVVNQRIQKVLSDGSVTAIAGDGKSASFATGDGGPAMNAELKLAIGLGSEGGLALDSAGNLFIADTGNHRIRRVSPQGVIDTVAGFAPPCSIDGCLPLGDGGPATSASLSYPTSVAVDGAGNLFIADTGHVCTRKVSTDGVITTVAPFTGRMAVDRDGNVFVAHGVVSKIAPDGNITVVAGSAALCDVLVDCPFGDGGPALSARLNATAIAVDVSGNLFIADVQADDYGSDCRIRKVTPDGLISTLVGGACRFNWSNDGGVIGVISGLTLDQDMALVATDLYNQEVNLISPEGTVRKIAGGAYGYSGDGGPAIGAAVRYPTSIVVDRGGNIYFSDVANNVVRVLKPVLGGDR